MIDISILAWFLLALRIASDIIIGWVISLQLRFIRNKVPKYLRSMRIVLLLLSMGIFVGNAIPIVVDVITIFTDNSIGRSQSLGLYSVLYATSNALTAFISAFMVGLLYWLAGRPSDGGIFEDTQHSREVKSAITKQ